MINAILDSHPRTGSNLTRVRANVAKLDHELEEEEDKISESTESHDSKSVVVVTSDPILLDHDHSQIDNGNSQIGDDDFSLPDEPMPNNLVTVNNTENFENDIPFWNPASWPGILDNLLEVAEYDYEMRRILRLAAPFALDELSTGVLEVTNVAFIGRFVGTRAVTAYVTVDMLVGLSSTLVGGFSEGLVTLCGQALGAGNNKLVGQYFQLAIIMDTVLFIPIIVMWYFFMATVLEWFGFDEETVRIGAEFSKIYVVTELLEGCSEIVDDLLDITGKELYSTIVSSISDLLTTLCILAVSLSKHSSLTNIGYVLFVAEVLSLIFDTTIIAWRGWFDPYLSGIVGSFSLTVSTVVCSGCMYPCN